MLKPSSLSDKCVQFSCERFANTSVCRETNKIIFGTAIQVVHILMCIIVLHAKSM